MTDTALVSLRICEGCRAALPSSLLACPSCGQLVHATALKHLAAEASGAEAEHDTARALASWRQALELLPPGSGQHQRLLEKVQTLSAHVTAGPSATPAREAAAGDTREANPRAGRAGKWTASLGAVGVVLAKFKWLIVSLFAKGKLLLFGLAQLKTLFSMLLTLGVYSSAFGWQFALGFVVSIYIHEMGHVAALRHYGIPASAPMFIPGFGAFVRMNAHPATVGEDARVGLAGPLWGTAAAGAALAGGLLLSVPQLVAIAGAGAYINLFNLIPVWQLDGGRGFAALARPQRVVVALALWALAIFVGDGMLVLLAIGASFRALVRGTAPEQGDREVLASYLALVAGLTWLMLRARP